MNRFSALLIAIGVSLLVSTIIVSALAKPLRQIVAMLCKSGESTSFWVSFTSVMLYVAPLFITVFWTSTFNTNPVDALQTALTTALFGAFAGLLIVGYKIAAARQI
jgi:hypothetical protein